MSMIPTNLARWASMQLLGGASAVVAGVFVSAGVLTANPIVAAVAIPFGGLAWLAWHRADEANGSPK